jgi:microsomal triglyceride transfer protein large subunit
MKALHVMPDFFFDRKTHRPILLKIVKQLGKKYDSSTRTLALDLLLRNEPEKEEMRELFTLLRRHDSLHAEVSTFMWHRLHEFMDTNPKLRAYVRELLKEEGLKTYHHLAPKGLSTAFSRTLTASPSSNSSFSNAIEMTGKILKRSSFDVYVRSQDDSIHPLSVSYK